MYRWIEKLRVERFVDICIDESDGWMDEKFL
jgi:hypothetical protein